MIRTGGPFSSLSVLFSASLLSSTDGHLSNTKSRSGSRAAKLQIRSNVFQIFEHLEQIACDGHLGNRECQLAVADPEAGGAAGVVAGDDIGSESHQLGD